MRWRKPRLLSCSTPHSYFPTVYEPTVFENYVHGASSPAGFRVSLVEWVANTIAVQISSSTVSISSSRCGIPPGKKNSTGYGVSRMVSIASPDAVSAWGQYTDGSQTTPT
jgi:hypothetical protein